MQRHGRTRTAGPNRRGGAGGMILRLLAAAVVALVSFVGYLIGTSENEITGEKQRVSLTTDEEIALGAEAAPQMSAEFGGLDRDRDAQARVGRVGGRLLAALDRRLAEQDRRNPYPFKFHVLDDDRTINAFALPGGQVFLTDAMYDALETEGQLAVVLGHEIGHVLDRHAAERLAKERLTQGLVGAAGVATGDVDATRLAAVVGTLVNMRHGRGDELESDRWGVRLAADAGYDPRAVFGVMQVLEKAGGAGGPEFLSTHPKPANRVEYAEQVLAEEFPEGVPEGLTP